MKTVGIICEYNPFHHGHQRQLGLIREQLGPDCSVVCVMSGNYVQRGMPAMWDKYTRAEAAVACGADLVLELPLTKVLQSAEGFARGGVDVLSRLGIVDHLCFGAEADDSEKLIALAQKLDEPQCRSKLLEALAQGLPYAAARQQAVGDIENLLSKPNNILGVEYCRAITHLNSPLAPLIIHRTGDYHARTPDFDAPSATAIRSRFPSDDWHRYMPEAAAALLEDRPWYDVRFGERAVLARLRALSDEEWERCAHGSEGLWSKAMKACRSLSRLADITDAVKSKRYPMTRIQRLLLCAYLGISSADLSHHVSHSRILAASEVGRKLIRRAKEFGSLPLITPGQTPDDSVLDRLEARASDLFTLFSSDDHFPCCTDKKYRLFGK